MKNLFLWILFYTSIMAVSQVLIKFGTDQIGVIKITGVKDVYLIGLQVLKNPFILGSIVLLVSSFFLWLYILSWFKLGLIFPLTALTYVFVALLSYFMLGERLSSFNYFGIAFIATGVFFLLYR